MNEIYDLLDTIESTGLWDEDIQSDEQNKDIILPIFELSEINK